MTPQSLRIGTTEVLIIPAESEDGSFTASTRGHKYPDQLFGPADWSDPRTRTDAARTICESFSITRNNQNMTKLANAIDAAMS